MNPKSKSGLNPHKARRESVAPARGKEKGSAVGQAPPSKHAGNKNIAGTTNRQSY